MKTEIKMFVIHNVDNKKILRPVFRISIYESVSLQINDYGGREKQSIFRVRTLDTLNTMRRVQKKIKSIIEYW